MSSTLIHITPQLPPNIGGVADYAVILGQRVEEQTDRHIRSTYIQAGFKDGKAPDASLPHEDLSGQSSSDELVQAVRAFVGEASRACVLLHYVGYGYQQRGCPWWLLQVLRQLRRKRPRVQLVTMFHELYATSRKPWESAFWATPLQRYIAAKIARLSDGIMTNREASAQWLRSQVNGQPIRVSPVFSNVGEPETVLSYEKREPYAVVFGGTGKKVLYSEYSQTLVRLLRKADINTLIDIGPPPTEREMEEVNGVHVESLGFIAPSDVSSYLESASLGLLCRNPKALTKSGSLAAYMAHGVPSIIVLRHHTQPNQYLKDNIHYLSLEKAVSEGSAIGKAEWKEVGQRGRAWYIENAHSRQTARTFLELVDSV